MEAQPQWVGIDVSKASLDVHLRPSQQRFQFTNHAAPRGNVLLMGCVLSLRLVIGVESWGDVINHR